ncbi:MAG: hypothetical protein PHO27_06240 [Sulfuricurvum sp.]|nr:hypothetical protein [Sulfuricurvum sp.]
MKQCNTFEDLQALGTEKIHEKTHISRDKVELVLTKSYGDIGRVQFMGFMSILEREYGIDLNSIKQEYLEFQSVHQKTMPQKESVILQATSNSKPKWMLVGVVLIALLLIAGYIAQGKMANVPHEDVINLTSAVVQVANDSVDMNVSDENETNATVEIVPEKSAVVSNISKPIDAGKLLILRPVYKVWYGMINMATGERVQNVTTEPISIDLTKNWLIFLGHGRIEIESSAGKTELKEKETVRFICENGILKQISKDEFIEKNGGKNW